MNTSLFTPFGTDLDLTQGVMKDPDTHIVRTASDMRGYYEDAESLETIIGIGDPLHYEVFEKDIPEKQGHLRFCISKLQPGMVGGEFYMTKGHFHEVSYTAELYMGLCGEGYIIMKTSDGACEVEPIRNGRLVYIPPFWAHRSVNTGNAPLISFCVYPAHAGHNYGDIKKEGFSKRIFNNNGKIEFMENI